MNRNQRVARMAATAMLIAVGIVIPMLMPKVYIPPMSFTLASHVAVFLSMFLSPSAAAAVALGTTAGFFYSGLPADVWARALTHVFWAVGGAFWLRRHSDTLFRPVTSGLFCLFIALVHGALELLVVLFMFLGGLGGVSGKFTGVLAVCLLVGGGTVAHSCVDYVLSLIIWRPLSKVRRTE